MPRTCGKCCPPATHASRSRTRRQSALRQLNNWIADAFGFEMLSPEDFEAGAKHLLKRVTNSAFSFTGAAGGSIGLLVGRVLAQAAGASCPTWA